MSRIYLVATVIRRALIVVFGVLLLPHAFAYMVLLDGSGDRREIDALGHDGPVIKYKTDATIKLDDDVLRVDAVYATPKQTVLHYSIRRSRSGGWSFPESALKLIDDTDGKELVRHSSSSRVNPWGAIGTIHHDAMTGPHSSLTLKLEWFDRQASASIPLIKEADGR